MVKPLLCVLVVFSACKEGIGGKCVKDDECADDLVCFSAKCTTQLARKTELDAARVKDVTTRARAFLRERFRMTEETAASLCIAGETAVVAVDMPHKLEFCLRPKGDTFEVGYFGPIALRVCDGALGESEQLGDGMNHCRR